MEYLLWTFDDNEFRLLTGEYQNGIHYLPQGQCDIGVNKIHVLF